ncbi:uncharacterized protein LACBIDRAFT_304118 [Laccaria bicolor S238N-H82]|uniref:Predicted protein n=1 Tax=Laccaria bicolor (strain S238N-H82 / ATCC MYA-4686) TaxID=486041 RepID=B0DKZ7_LACBS|nr:uncharacterized protein LACBIDRAFT_304118 [Laccaria bicolor S238N-H82]EDR04735.1 predicted protein [Laccaria bicolor S238N-H82]|eukprot:XP_001884559.1 predicted protein [Laccaria bicolor S238N-H82]
MHILHSLTTSQQLSSLAPSPFLSQSASVPHPMSALRGSYIGKVLSELDEMTDQLTSQLTYHPTRITKLALSKRNAPRPTCTAIYAASLSQSLWQ